MQITDIKLLKINHKNLSSNLQINFTSKIIFYTRNN